MKALDPILETYQELPERPPFRTLVLFAHFDPQGIVAPHVIYYLEALKSLGTTIVFVSNSPTLTPESVDQIRPLCAGIYTRENTSFDPGAWHRALCLLQEHGWSLQDFDRLVFTNDTVYGPLFPIEEMWNTFHGADMYGAIEGSQKTPHMQGFFVVWDLDQRTRQFLDDFWARYEHADKYTCISRYEIGFSVAAREAGFRLKPFLSNDEVKAICARSPASDWYRPGIAAPTAWDMFVLGGWDILIEYGRFPFLKSRALRNPTGFKGPWRGPTTWQDSMNYLQQFIGQHTEYPFEFIASHVERLGYAPADDVPDLSALSHQALRQIMENCRLTVADRALVKQLGHETDRVGAQFRSNPSEQDLYADQMGKVFQQTRALITKYTG